MLWMVGVVFFQGMLLFAAGARLNPGHFRLLVSDFSSLIKCTVISMANFALLIAMEDLNI